MLNDWKWDSDLRLRDNRDNVVAYLGLFAPEKWFCRLDNNDYNIHYSVTLEGLKSKEEAVWQATVWIYNECNAIANSFHRIRDHLPSIHELADNYRSKEIIKMI